MVFFFFFSLFAPGQGGISQHWILTCKSHPLAFLLFLSFSFSFFLKNKKSINNSETQPLPTPLSWFAFHALHPLAGKVITAAVLAIEILVPFLFFATAPFVRALAACLQLSLQLAIALMGNYGFSGLLTSVLCLSLFDDRTLSSALWLFRVQLGEIPPLPDPTSNPPCSPLSPAYR